MFASVTRLQTLGEAKLAALVDSKSLQRDTVQLMWEKDRLSLELEDMQARWTEIQHTKVHNLKQQKYCVYRTFPETGPHVKN